MSGARAIFQEAFEHFANDRLEEAVDGYLRAIEADPELAIAWNGLSRALMRKGDLEGAIEAGRRLIELAPDDPLSHTNLSILYQQHGMIQEAEEERAHAMRLQREQDGGR